MNEEQLRMEMVRIGKSLFDRGYAVGGAGNISARIDGESIIATPSGSSFGRLSAGELSVVDMTGKLLSGPRPSKEIQFHLSLYRGDQECGAVLHLHSTWSTLLACRNDINPDEVIHPFTPYYVMKIGTLPLIPYYPPGDIGIARELAAYAGRHTAFLLQNHGPVVTGKSLSEAGDTMEELEETAKLSYLLEGSKVRYLSSGEIAALKKGR
ncbi:3-oxo-tetronate 4-phosphate decarboxylase [Sediminispirochaeta smaragdinae]|uniref:3-oxo-tetronate 4-phosphate decarboxylase n=1 Tax=Sediminispirochaeta smaragdinae (strain DSM 11293 / JCM 15392 / SEBR 4228) TaxID=573413 RepID=E1R2U9_SEDSS|nr:aldolase [Sediminispirochaeta smaragdinae]ADK80381.1 class II aldolase/adducin family protein [Sediminispirochaeta smaragdinae DSM 11293]